jgi:hypothetical protein
LKLRGLGSFDVDEETRGRPLTRKVKLIYIQPRNNGKEWKLEETKDFESLSLEFTLSRCSRL